jgi:hypothetical protein
VKHSGERLVNFQACSMWQKFEGKVIESGWWYPDRRSTSGVRSRPET